MDLGIDGKRAIVCGGSSGLGRAIARALSLEGVHVTLVARDEARLADAAGAIRTAGGPDVQTLSVDLAEPAQRDTLVGRLTDVDILINNAGGPPVGDYLDFTRDQWLTALQTNMLSAIELMNAALPGMRERRFGRIVNVTSHAVKAPIAPLSLSNGARAGLTGYVSGVAKDVAQDNVTINNLMPGQFETDRLKSNHAYFAEARGVTFEEIQVVAKNEVPAARFGDPEEFGAYAAFLCSVHAGFVTGQNLMVDGGQYPGLI